MKKANKILLFTLIGTIVVTIGAFLAVSGSKCITNLGIVCGGIHDGFENLKMNYSATFGLITGTLVLIAVGLGALFAIQVRRKKTKGFTIYTWLFLLCVYALIVGASQFKTIFNSLDNKALTSIVIAGGILIMLQLFAKAILSVAYTFEASDLQANSKKSDAIKLVDLIVAIALIVLFVPVVFYISGGKFDVFSHFFTKTITGKSGALPLILIIVQVFIVGFVLYKLIKGRKTVLGPLFVLFGEFACYTYYYYGNVKMFSYNGKAESQLGHGFSSHLASGNILQMLVVLGILLYLLAIIFYTIYQLADVFIIFFENKRQKLYNHREKYVYGDRRRFGDSIVKEWENSKNAQYAQSFSTTQMPAGLEEFEEIVETNQNVNLNDLGIDNEELLAEQGSAEGEISTVEALEDDIEDSKKAVKVSKLNLNEEAAQQDFRVKLMLLEPEKQARYNKIRNKLQSYKKIKQKFSKTVDSYRYAGELVAKVSVLGSTLRLHLALDPDSYDVEKYHHVDLSSKSKYIFVPFTLKLKGPKSVELALQLIEELMTGFDIPQNANYKEVDYVAEVQKELEAEQNV